MTTGLPAYQQQVPAGVWARLGGSIIDYLLLTLLYVGMVVGMFDDHTKVRTLPPLLPFDYALSLIFNSSLVFYALPLIFITLSAMLLVGAFGTTLGKRAMGTHVLVYDGSRVGYRRALLRELAKFPPLLVISAFMIVFRRDRLGLHDLISDTMPSLCVDGVIAFGLATPRPGRSRGANRRMQCRPREKMSGIMARACDDWRGRSGFLRTLE